MKLKKNWLVSIALIVALGATMLWVSWISEDAKEQVGLVEEKAAIGNEVGDGVAVETFEAIEERIPLSETRIQAQIAEIEGGWKERYPKAVLEEEAFAKEGNGVVLRRQSLATGAERIKHVVWEERFQETPAGQEWVLLGRVAYVADAFIVDTSRVSSEALEQFVEEHGYFFERVSRFSEYVTLGIRVVDLDSVDRAIIAFQQAFPGALAERDHLRFTAAVPNDWDASKLWGLDVVQARDAWEFETGNSEGEVVVAVIDTGMQRTHPDLADNLFVREGSVEDVSGWDFVNDDSDPNDEDGHGTHVAGIVGAVGNNGLGVVGVNWNVKLLPLKVGDFQGLRTSAINDALAYVTELKFSGINIVATNNSYGSGGSNVTTQNEIRRHQDLGILFVAAAGNDGKNMDASPASREYPAGYELPIVVSVGNSNQEDVLSASSNYGLESVDLSAPGTEIYSTYPRNRYTSLSGTSMASPMVAGAVALLAKAEPDLSASEIKARLMETADPISGQSGLTVSGGRLNALAALKPGLSGHEVEVTNVQDAFALVDSPSTTMRFEVAALPAAELRAEILEGEDLGELMTLDDRVFSFEPNGVGHVKLRFVAELDGIERVEEKQLFIGETGDVREGLLHHFDFSGQGNSVPDLARSATGSLIGANRAQSEFGTSLNLDASAEKMSFSGVFSEQVTIAALVRSDNLVASAHPRIVNMPFYYLYFSSGEGPGVPDGNRQTLKFYSNFTNFGVWNTPPKSVVDDQWYYVVGTYDSNDLLNTPNIYINGDKQVVRMQQEPSGQMIRTGGLSYVGNNDIDDRSFSGLIGDVRVYNRELSGDDVARLGAALVQDSWSTCKINGPITTQLGSVAEFSIQVGNSSRTLESVEWNFESESGLELVSFSGNVLSVRFNDVGANRLHAQVSDGLSTYALSMEVRTINSQTQSGRYSGITNGGGLFSIEIDESLDSGTITVFDPESGFYRIEEPITLNESGYFQTTEDSVGKIVGTALGIISGQVAGYGVNFASEANTPSSNVSDFSGLYHGGTLGTLGDSLYLEVFNDGSAMLVRQGPLADLVLSEVDEEGVLAGVSALGLEVELGIDEATLRVSGSWGGKPIFLARPDFESSAVLNGGIVAAAPSGESGFGLYASFLEVGAQNRGDIELGGYASGLGSSSGSGVVLALNERGRWIPVPPSPEQGIAERLAALIDSGTIEFGGKELSAIRAQLPLAGGAAGVVAFSLKGDDPIEILARGLGPSFALGSLADPSARLYRVEEELAMELGTNDDWREGTLFTGENEKSQGAFLRLEEAFDLLELTKLEDEAKDAAFRVWLEPGVYLIEIRAEPSLAGPALIELLPL